MPGQRKQRADGERTREAIVREAVSLATLDGLEGLSIGNLAGALDMSKSGVYAHFGSKQELQLATVDEAGRIFQAEVIEPALAAAPGLAQLVAVCDAFFDHLVRRTFPGGCFFAGAVLEMGTRPGPVKEQIAAFQGGFTALIRQFVVTALEQHELPADEDPDALTFELNGIILAANTNFVLREDPAALDMASNVRIPPSRSGDGPEGESCGELPHASAQLRWLEHAEVDVEHRHVQGEMVEVVGAGGEQRGVFVDRLEHTDGRGHELGDALDRRVELDPCVVAIRRGADRALHERHRVGRIDDVKAVAGGRCRLDAVDAPGAPFGLACIASDQIPAPADADHPMGEQTTFAAAAGPVAVPDSELVGRAAGGADRAQDRAVDVVDR